MSALALQSFGYGEQLVRAVERDGAAWLVANDVCAALEIANPRDAVRKLEDDEKDDVGITDAIGRQQSMTIVSESGVYALIFKSRKPAARAFRKWVTSEVLPQIRATGCFVPDKTPRFALPEGPDELETLRLKISLVRTARIVHGRRAARQIWADCGLPEVASDLVPEGIEARWPSVADWYRERALSAPGAWTRTMALHSDYVRWCQAREMAPETIKSFGLALNELGHRSLKKDGQGRKLRRDIALAD